MVLFFRSATPKSVFLNRFVINIVSLPMYVKETHLCVAFSVCLFEVVVGYLWVGVLSVWIGKTF